MRPKPKIIKGNKCKKLSHLDCYYCGCHDKDVEAGGIWYCPNAFCDGPGSVWFNSRLKSYKEQGDKKYSIDRDEKNFAAKLFHDENPLYEIMYGKA